MRGQVIREMGGRRGKEIKMRKGLRGRGRKTRLREIRKRREWDVKNEEEKG